MVTKFTFLCHDNDKDNDGDGDTTITIMIYGVRKCIILHGSKKIQGIIISFILLSSA